MQTIEHNMLLVVAGVIINNNNKVLISKRPEGKHLSNLWEFPGGKIKKGETPEKALERELKEELDISINTDKLKPITFASHSYKEFHLLMPLFLCEQWGGNVKPMENQEIRWIEPEAIINYPMPPADKPLIKNLINWLEYNYSILKKAR